MPLTMSLMDAASASVQPRTDPVSPPAVVEPGPALPGDRLARYSRQLLMPGFGEDAQRRLANARVLVVGAGGLGSASIPYLTGAGVGTIGIIDTDIVELSNLHRQISHGMRNLLPSPPAPDEVLSCSVGGVLPSVCASIGAIMSTEAIKLITGIGEPLIGRVTTYDALPGRYRELAYRTSPEAAPITELIDYELFCGHGPTRR